MGRFFASPQYVSCRGSTTYWILMEFQLTAEFMFQEIKTEMQDETEASKLESFFNAFNEVSTYANKFGPPAYRDPGFFQSVTVVNEKWLPVYGKYAQAFDDYLLADEREHILKKVLLFEKTGVFWTMLWIRATQNYFGGYRRQRTYFLENLPKTELAKIYKQLSKADLKIREQCSCLIREGDYPSLSDIAGLDEYALNY